MGGNTTRALAARLSPRARRLVRRLTDRALAPVGSVYGVRTRAPVVALTYDDGPDPEGTPAVLDALAEAGVRATFFQLVYRAERHPDLVRRIVEAGHEVGLHGVDHTRITDLAPDRVRPLLAEGRARLEDLAGRAVRWYRPPYGAQSARTYVATRRAGLDPVVWGPTARDWVDGEPGEVAARALPVAPGRVVLLHDAYEAPPGDPGPPPSFDRGEVARILLAGLRDAGVGVTTVSGLAGHGPVWRTAWFRP